MEKTKLIEIRVKSHFDHVLKVIRIQSGEEVNGEEVNPLGCSALLSSIRYSSLIKTLFCLC